MYCIRLTGWLVEFLCVACVLIWRKDIASRDVANRAEIERNRATGGGRRPDSVGELDRRVASGHSTQLLSLKTLLFLTCWLRLFYCQLLCVRVRVCPLYISPTTLGNRRRQKNKELKKVRKTWLDFDFSSSLLSPSFIVSVCCCCVWLFVCVSFAYVILSFARRFFSYPYFPDYYDGGSKWYPCQLSILLSANTDVSHPLLLWISTANQLFHQRERKLSFYWGSLGFY